MKRLCKSLSEKLHQLILHGKNKMVKITNLLVSIVARNSGNCNLIHRVGFYDCMVIYMLL